MTLYEKLYYGNNMEKNLLGDGNLWGNPSLSKIVPQNSKIQKKNIATTTQSY